MHRFLISTASVTALALSLAAPARAEAPVTCPGGWSGVASGTRVLQCIAPIGIAKLEVMAFETIGDKDLADAMYGYERLVGADGTPLNEMLAETMGSLGGEPALVRDYEGLGNGGVALHVRLMLTRQGNTDYLVRAIWDQGLTAVQQPLVEAALAGWSFP